MTTTSYLIAWLFYLLGCGAGCAVFWRMTRPLPWSLVKHYSRLSVVIILLVPFSIEPGSGYYAPALMIACLEGLFEEALPFSRAGLPLLFIWLSLMATITFGHFIWSRFANTPVDDDIEPLSDDLTQAHDELVTESQQR